MQTRVYHKYSKTHTCCQSSNRKWNVHNLAKRRHNQTTPTEINQLSTQYKRINAPSHKNHVHAAISCLNTAARMDSTNVQKK